MVCINEYFFKPDNMNIIDFLLKVVKSESF